MQSSTSFKRQRSNNEENPDAPNAGRGQPMRLGIPDFVDGY
jgi:hypothetical protein